VLLPVAVIAAGGATAVLLVAHRGGATVADRPRIRVVVTTSLLEAAVRDLTGGAVEVERLVPPGSCPGHFDLRPADLERLLDARLVLLDVYQRPLAARLEGIATRCGEAVLLPESRSPLVPDGYAALLEELARRAGPALGLDTATARLRLERLGRRLERLGTVLRREAAPMRGVRVVSSVRLAELCRWLGLEVVATLPPNGDASPRALLRSTAAAPELVVASLQEGIGAARALAERYGVPVAVLSTFPGAPGFGSGYEELLRSDVRRLEEAWRASPSRSTR